MSCKLSGDAEPPCATAWQPLRQALAGEYGIGAGNRLVSRRGPAVNGGTCAASAILIGWVGGSYVADGRLAARKAGQARSRSVRADILEGLRWLAKQRLLRTMAILIGLLNVTLTGAMALLVLLARERLRAGSVGYGLLSPARRLARSLVQP